MLIKIPTKIGIKIIEVRLFKLPEHFCTISNSIIIKEGARFDMSKFVNKFKHKTTIAKAYSIQTMMEYEELGYKVLFISHNLVFPRIIMIREGDSDDV